MTEAADTAKALRALARRDPDLKRAIALCGPLPDRTRDGGLATLMRIIVEQQLSVASAKAIWGRVLAACEPFTADRFLKLREPRLRKCGLSGPKIRYCRELARATVDGSLDFAALESLPEAEAMEMLLAVKGIGRWTAEIYLMFALGRPDLWPAGDVALQAAVHHLKGLDARPDHKQMDAIAEAWRPYRTTAARLMWRYYAVIRQSTKDLTP